MASFYFKAVAADGKPRTGTVTADDPKTVAKELRKQGLIPVYVGIEKQKGFDLKLPSWQPGRKKDVLFFTQEMTTLLVSGIPVDRSLSIATELTEKQSFRLVLSDVIRVLKGGKTLADSLGTHPEYFSDLYVNMVRAGEASGSLATVFERLSEFEKTRDELQGYIISSLLYPGLLSLVGVGSILVLLNFVVPRFAKVFEESRMEIPTPTKIMLETSKFLQTYGPGALIGFAVAVVAFIVFVKTAEGRFWWDSFKLKVPILGDALRKAETARFARAMGTLVANSVPLVQSISISGAILNNKKIAGCLDAVSQGVKRGEGIAGPVRKSGQFPPLAAHLLTVGEETGKLDAMFVRMADVYEEETKTAIRRFTTIFEPLVILIMGIVVGALILSMLLAITSINEVAV